MKMEIIPIGNSKGIRIPKAILQECGFNGTVELQVKGGKLIISPGRKVREGWAEDAKRCHEAGDDKLLWPENMSDPFGDDVWPPPKK